MLRVTTSTIITTMENEKTFGNLSENPPPCLTSKATAFRTFDAFARNIAASLAFECGSVWREESYGE
jgi:hypothetical protein